MRTKALLVAGLTVSVAGCLGQEMTFTNRTATFTNLEGRLYRDVELIRADADGVIYRQGASGGLVCYTNLAPQLLETLGIPTNRIESARARADAKAAALVAERRRVQQQVELQASMTALAKKLVTLETTVNGNVISVSPAGLLVECPVYKAYPISGVDHFVTAVVSDYPKSAADGDPIHIGGDLVSFDYAKNQLLTQTNLVKCYFIGFYKLGEQTLRHYTCDPAKAITYLKQAGAVPQ